MGLGDRPRRLLFVSHYAAIRVPLPHTPEHPTWLTLAIC